MYILLCVKKVAGNFQAIFISRELRGQFVKYKTLKKYYTDTKKNNFLAFKFMKYRALENNQLYSTYA